VPKVRCVGVRLQRSGRSFGCVSEVRARMEDAVAGGYAPRKAAIVQRCASGSARSDVSCTRLFGGEIMLSARARNVLMFAGFDLTDLAGTVLKVRAALATGVRWRNCGKKTLRELEAWADEPTVQANQINEELVERGAVAVLESRGYTVIPPNAPLHLPTEAQRKEVR
jgi:hypothetical protein